MPAKTSKPRTSVAERVAQNNAATTEATETGNAGWNDEKIIRDLNPAVIMPNRYQPRKEFDQPALNSLASSIKQHGVQQPITVREIASTLYDGRQCVYELVAGERRWRASKQAELNTIPSIVKNVSDDDLRELALIENLQRENLHPLDEAEALHQLREQHNLTYEDLSKRLGKSTGYLQNRLRLRRLPDGLQALVRERPDTLGHMYELLRLSDPKSKQLSTEQQMVLDTERDELAKDIQTGLSRAATRRRVQAVFDRLDMRDAKHVSGNMDIVEIEQTIEHLEDDEEHVSGNMDVAPTGLGHTSGQELDIINIGARRGGGGGGGTGDGSARSPEARRTKQRTATQEEGDDTYTDPNELPDALQHDITIITESLGSVALASNQLLTDSRHALQQRLITLRGALDELITQLED